MHWQRERFSEPARNHAPTKWVAEPPKAHIRCLIMEWNDRQWSGTYKTLAEGAPYEPGMA